MIYKETQTSLLDFLTHIMPEMKDVNFYIFQKPKVNKKAINKLISIWKDNKPGSNPRRFTRDMSISKTDLDMLEKENLIRQVGTDEIEITAKGVDVIKTSILGDERSAFEDSGDIIDYETSLANTKSKIKTASKKKSNWYSKIKNG